LHHPARQAAFRLSRQQRADLKDALSPHTLTRPLLQAIEDSLFGYRAQHEQSKRQRPAFGTWLKHAERAQRLACELRELLPLFSHEDDSLVIQLERRAASWTAFIDQVPPPSNHRPPNSEIAWTCFRVVKALDAAQIPLTLGRNTVVVEVLRLVRGWADQLDGGRPRRRQNNYEFSRAVVQGYLRSPK
jgi:hypothetical protein